MSRSRRSWRCRRGWHRFEFKNMTNRREINSPFGVDYICTIVDRCARCGLRRTRWNASVPKRVRTNGGKS